MLRFEAINDEILRLCVPFENIYTAVFLIRTEQGDVLVDSATTAMDAERIILPALRDVGANVKTVVCTHLHGDHGGGLRTLAPQLPLAVFGAYAERILTLLPEAKTVQLADGDMLHGVLRILHLPGHSMDSIGILDTRSNTLLSGDAVQLYGITRYGCGVGSPVQYRATLARLKALPIERLVASHEYVPLGAVAVGREAVAEYLAEASADFAEIVSYVESHACIGDAREIAVSFTAEYANTVPDMPLLQASTVKAILEE